VEISADRVKELREKTGAGVMDCKKALTDASGDMDKAVALLREKGLAQAAKRSGREASEGIVEAYIHAGGKIGVIVEINCETDFVARTSDFKELAHDVAMQIAATNPTELGDKEVENPDPNDLPLLQQPFIKDPKRTIADLVRDTAAKTGENVVIRRFARFELGA
jgi:elongation factor Ts